MEKSQFNINLGNAIRDVRQELGISQEVMADKAGLSRNYIGEIERGEKSITVYALFELLEANDISVSKFMERV
jgi:transcriptional regulator with XRE-family HTH domain